jgi:predicted 2-oxoglutarate/Fe(II)-dependent dioxygenase YbiX
MTLALNDDYEGGGICFPEYSPTVLPLEKYSAVIFPGSLFHEVQPIDRGKRYVVISFFFGDGEAAVKPDAERFKIKTNRGTDALSLRAITPTSMD